jgi:hypothetical protein
MNQQIPTIGLYRNVPLHDFQSGERVETIVKPAIDDVFATAELGALVAYAGDTHNPPESRLLAAALAEASFDVAAEERRERPELDVERLRASIAGLRSARWINSRAFNSLLDTPPRPGERGPDERDPENRVRVEQFQATLRGWRAAST